MATRPSPDPAPIIHTLMTDPVIVNRFALDGIVTTVDAVNAPGQLDTQHESVKQAAVADRIVMTKSDLVGADKISDLEDRLRRINPGAPIHRAVMGALHPNALFDAGLYDPRTKSLDVQRWLREEAYLDRDDHHHHDVNRHDDRIRAHCLVLDSPLPWEIFVTWIQTLIAVNGEDLLRIKGIVDIVDQEGPIAVHGVQHLFHDPVRLPDWPDDDRRSRIVFITRSIEREVIEKSLERLLGDR